MMILIGLVVLTDIILLIYLLKHTSVDTKEIEEKFDKLEASKLLDKESTDRIKSTSLFITQLIIFLFGMTHIVLILLMGLKLYM